LISGPRCRNGDKGLFTREIEEQLLNGAIDMAVHSMKDLPTRLPDGLTIGAVTEREDPRDVLISKGNRKLSDLTSGDTVATSSLRRRAQLLSLIPGIRIVDIRGNLNTRLDKLSRDPLLTGIVLAHAGLIRMDLTDRIAEIIPRDTIIPAVGQASLAVEIRENDDTIKNLAAFLHDTNAAMEIECERSFLRTLEGGCQVPIAGSAVMKNHSITLTGLVASLDGKRVFRASLTGDPGEAVDIGIKLARVLLDRGAKEVLDEIYSSHRTVEEAT